jgi:methyl-accepting chemotaxis protein
MNFSFSSISAKLKGPMILQALLMAIAVYYYFSSEYAVRAEREQAKELGVIVSRLQAMTMDIQEYLNGHGDFKKIESNLREQSERIGKLSKGVRSSLEPSLKVITEQLQGTAKQFQRNNEIETTVFQLTKLSTEQSDTYIMETSRKLADPQNERQVSKLERLVLGGAAVNSGTNHNIREMFLRMKDNPNLRKEMIAFLDTAIRNVIEDEKRLVGTPYHVLATKAKEANTQIRDVVTEYLANVDKVSAASKEVDKQVGLMRSELNILSEKNMLAGYDFFRSRISTLLAVLLVVSVIVVALTLALSRVILRPINRMTEMLRGVAEGAGDLTTRIKVESQDEIGEACALFNIFIEKLHGVISLISATSNRVATASSQLHSTSDQIAHNAEEVATQARTVATAGEEMSATSGAIAQNCQKASEGAERASQSANNGGMVVERTVIVMGQIAQKVQETAKTVESLGQRSDQIGAIIGTIEDIADQTNLLALNAAIEAARAGEQGRGFAVVADEVRALAERTTRATKEIGEMIKAIQRETKGAVEAMEQGVQQVETGTEEAAKSGQALLEILEQVNDVATQVHQIATAAEEQTATTGEISSKMMQITEVVQQTSRGAHESATAAAQLNGSAEELQRLVRQFKL